MTADQILDEFRVWARDTQEILVRERRFETRRSELEDHTIIPDVYKAVLDLKSEDFLASFAVVNS